MANFICVNFLAGIEMSSEEDINEAASVVENTHPNVSTAFSAFNSLFAECVQDLWTPLSADQRDRLACCFDETLARYLSELDPTSFGFFIFQISPFHSISSWTSFI